MKRSILALAISAVFLLALGSAQGQEIDWFRTFGTPDFEFADSVAVDEEDVFVYGDTFGTLPGQVSAGVSDLFLRKYDDEGNAVWTRQFGSPGPDFYFGSGGVATDDDRVFVVGHVLGPLPGQFHAGFFDAFLRAYDTDGNELWTRQFGTPGFDDLHAVDVDDDDVFVAGSTDVGLPGQPFAGDFDVFVQRYDADGTLIWTRQFGTPGIDHPTAVAVEDDEVFVSGTTSGTLPGQVSAGFFDAFVRKYDSDGNLIWTRQFGTPAFDEAFALAVDDDDVFVEGGTEGTLPGQTQSGFVDTFVRKYDSDGNVIWTRQFGSPVVTFPTDIAVDDDLVFATGFTIGDLPGQTSAGFFDAFIRAYDADGNELWTLQFGTEGPDGAFGVAVDDLEDGVFVAGGVGGPLFGQPFLGGDNDAFVLKLDVEDDDHEDDDEEDDG